MNSKTLEVDYKLVARATHEAVRSFSAHECHVVPPMFHELPSEAQQVLIQSCKDALAGMSKEQFHNKWVERKEERGWV